MTDTEKTEKKPAVNDDQDATVGTAPAKQPTTKAAAEDAPTTAPAKTGTAAKATAKTT